MMMLFVAITLPPFWAICGGVGVVAVGGGTRVAELVMDDNDVEDDDVNAVDPESWDDRELWLMVWLNPGRPFPVLRAEGKTGAVFVRARGPWA